MDNVSRQEKVTVIPKLEVSAFVFSFRAYIVPKYKFKTYEVKTNIVKIGTTTGRGVLNLQELTWLFIYALLGVKSIFVFRSIQGPRFTSFKEHYIYDFYHHTIIQGIL